jgi:hypothetical protein
MNALLKNAIRKNIWKELGLLLLPVPKEDCKTVFQCHIFAHSPSGRHPNDKCQSTRGTGADLCKIVSLAALFGSNGNSYTIYMQSDVYVSIYIYIYICVCVCVCVCVFTI